MTAPRDPLAEIRVDTLSGPSLRHAVPWEALILQLDPLGRLSPAYPDATMALAEAARLRWRWTASDRSRLTALRPGDADGAAWLLCLMAVVGSDPATPAHPARFARSIVGRTIRGARRMLRGPHTDMDMRVVLGLDRSARDLRHPLARRVYEQWRDVVKGRATLALEVQDLLLALIVVQPPSPDSVTDVYTRALDALTTALERTWRLRSKPNRKGEITTDLQRLRELADRWEVERSKAKRALLRDALLECLAERAVPTKIRRQVGGFIRDGGTAATLRPDSDVPAREYLRWLGAETMSRARESLKDEDQAGRLDYYDRDLGFPAAADERPGPLDALDAADRVTDALASLDAIKEQGTDRQGEVLDVVLRAMQSGHTYGEAQRAAADALGLSHGAVRAHLSNLTAPLRRPA